MSTFIPQVVRIFINVLGDCRISFSIVPRESRKTSDNANGKRGPPLGPPLGASVKKGAESLVHYFMRFFLVGF